MFEAAAHVPGCPSRSPIFLWLLASPRRACKSLGSAATSFADSQRLHLTLQSAGHVAKRLANIAHSFVCGRELALERAVAVRLAREAIEVIERISDQ